MKKIALACVEETSKGYFWLVYCHQPLYVETLAKYGKK